MKEPKLRWAKKQLENATDCNRDSRKQMVEDFEFAAGDQWAAIDKEALESQGRPCLTFNFIKPYVDVIGGLAEQNKTRARATPVDVTDQFLCDVLNDIGYWVYNKYNLDDDEADAFENATIAGLGAVAMDINPDPKRFGEIRFSFESVYPCEVHTDPTCRKDSYKDAGHIFWDKWISKVDFKINYPDSAGDIDELFDTGSLTESLTPDSGSAIDAFDSDVEDDGDYNQELDLDYYDKTKDKVRVVHMEYFDVFDRYMGFNPTTGKVEEFSKKNLDSIKQRIPDFEHATIKDKKVKWLQFIGDKILYNDNNPMPIDGFSITPIVAYKDKRNGLSNYYGVVRLLKDPQREINKRWSQTLNLLNNQVQGGVFAEVDAFQDIAQAEDSMKESGAITWLKKGAISKGKIQEKHLPSFPDAPMKMQEFANMALRFISGINPDLLGHDSGRQEPGVVVKMRQQQGMTIISKIFNNYNKAKLKIFQNILYCVSKFMPDSQILRILGENDRYSMQNGIIADKKTGQQAMIRDVRNLEYNVNIQSAPGNMTKTMMELNILQEMAKAGMPIDPKIIIEKLDLPGDEKLAMIQYIENQSKQQMEMTQKEMEFQHGLEQAKVQQKDKIADMKRQLDMIKLQQKDASAQGDRDIEHANKVYEVDQKERDSRRKHSVDMAELEAGERQLVMDLITQFTENAKSVREQAGRQYA